MANTAVAKLAANLTQMKPALIAKPVAKPAAKVVAKSAAKSGAGAKPVANLTQWLKVTPEEPKTRNAR